VGLIEDLGAGPIALDTSIFIYFIERHARFAPLLRPLLRAADEGERELVTSALTLLEVLVVPYRAGNQPVAERYEVLLTRGRGIRIVELSPDVLRAAAQLRAATGARTPDALQLAAALKSGCTAFLTNDRRLPRVPGLRALQLASYAD
jgi:predicted nucleic acid-binding protein